MSDPAAQASAEPGQTGARPMGAPDGLPAASRIGATEWLDNEKLAIDERTDEGQRRAGLALSGGGIRSAAVCLGVLQAFQQHGLPNRFGWLSTVSGGGYTGIGWLARCAATGQRRFPYMPPEKAFNSETGEPETALYRLRNYASYLLAPGALPVLSVVGMLLRNLLVSLVIMLPPILVLAALFVILRPLGAALANGWIDTLVIGVASVLAFLALMAMRLQGIERGGGPGGAPAIRARIDRHATLVVIAILGLVAIVVVAALPQWLPEEWRALLGTIPVPKDLPGLFGGLAVLLASSTVVSPMTGRAAGVALMVIAAAVIFLLVAIAMKIGVVTLGEATYSWRWVTSIATLLAPAGGWTGILWFSIDANALSMHGFYRDRLADAFMGSSGPSPKLSELMPARTGGPLPIVNVTVAGPPESNMARRRGLVASPMAMTPLKIGSEHLGWAKTDVLEAADPDFDAMAAMALSGAAIAPHAGRMTGGAAAVFLKSISNARTGRWLPNPGQIGKIKGSFRASILNIWREMVPALPRSRDIPMVLVSDGGHWENLGVLSLAHRLCPVIVAIDAEADPALTFSGLGVATMLARLDAGTELSVETDRLRRQENGFSAAHWVEGKLLYPHTTVGQFIYIKATLTGDEPPDVLHYAATHPDFPHETTADQFFDEAQFEAYRALGEHIGRSVAPLITQRLKGGEVP